MERTVGLYVSLCGMSGMVLAMVGMSYVEFHAKDARLPGFWRRSRMSRREIESDLVNPRAAACITEVKDYRLLDSKH